MSGSCVFLAVLMLVGAVNVPHGYATSHPYKTTRLTLSPTEILYIEDGYPKQRTYKVEDFFWTGSGDGAPDFPEPDPWAETEHIPTTVYRTKTVMSTVYISIMTADNLTSTEPTTTDCAINCETTIISDGVSISPTPTIRDDSTTVTTPPAVNTTDRQFWLLTIIRTNNTEPVVTVLEQQLADVYSVAFRRQQEKHLGIGRRTRRNIKPLPNGKPVYVHIYNISKLETDAHKVEVLYHVMVAGQPVAAVTAARDMKLVSDEEVSKALGYPILTKAEPYLRPEQPQRLARTRDTWLFVGVVLSTIVILIIIVTFFSLCLKKKSSSPTRTSGISNRQQVFDKEVGGEHVNEGFVEDNGHGKTYQSGKRHKKQPADTLSGQYQKGISLSSPSISSTSSSSSGLSSSPVLTPKPPIGRRRQHKHSAVGVKRPVALNKALIQRRGAVESDSGESSERGDSEAGLVKGRVSPKSYLSMPSVKSFPRSSIPETLNRVLEPVSVLHLDMTDDVTIEPFPGTTDFPEIPPREQPLLARHASMGGEDPGVIGPVVWNLHCRRMKENAEVDEPDDIKSMTRMRRRFNDLLDDTFTLFGSGRESTTDWERGERGASSQTTRCLETRGHSATNIRLLTETQAQTRTRPKTSDSRRVAPSPGVDPPRHGAWDSDIPSPMVRPLSAGPFHRPQATQGQNPKVEMERVLADSCLPPGDPAVPLIAAIKTELNKCSLPGSTNNLAE